MRITEANADEFLSMSSDVKENLEMVEEAIEDWKSAREAEPKDQEEIRAARETLDEVLEQLDVASLCQLVHGKHKR